MKCLNLIKNSPLLSSLSEAELSSAAETGRFRIVSYEKDNIIHFEGQICSKLEVILTGRIAVDRIDETGNLMTITELVEGDIYGGNILFSAEPSYPMTVTAKSFLTVLEVDKELLFELLYTNREFLAKYLEFVSDHSFILGNKIRNSVNRTIRERVLIYLEYESKRQNSNYIRLPLTKKQLAERLGVQRTSLSRELAKMRKEGLILFDADSITILK